MGEVIWKKVREINGDLSKPASITGDISGAPIVDLSGDTVKPGSMLEGVTAHQADGTRIVGTLKVSAIYTGSEEPDSSIGRDGDIYFQLGG